MANLKEVRNRISSVKSTQQITKAMKMVAAAKLRRAQNNMMQMRPYAQKLNMILRNVASSADDNVENPFAEERQPHRGLIVLITSDRGLCGAFNANAIKGALHLLKTKYSALDKLGRVRILCVGKKGYDYFKKREYDIKSDYVHLFADLKFDQAKEAAEYVMQAYMNKGYDMVDIVYNEFINVATQVVVEQQFLPIINVTGEESIPQESTPTNYIYEPSKEKIFEQLIPLSLKVLFYKALLESNAAEHGARMTAMDQATENAGDLLKDLKLTYNRSRQAAITTEILEIVGGAEALGKG